MIQNISIKLKLNLSVEQKDALRKVTLAYRDALNHASRVAFENGNLSNGTKLQKLIYYDIRAKYNLPAQMACNVPRQVAANYKSLWTKVRQNNQARLAGHTKTKIQRIG